MMTAQWKEEIARARRNLLLRSPVWGAVDGVFRSAFAGVALAQTLLDYQAHQWFGSRGPKQLSRVHHRTARRILRVCWWHGGIYTKLGQYLSTMGHILPLEVTEPLGVLTDRAQAVDWSEIEQVIEQDFGKGATHRMFSSVDPKPVASASLAQVHRAVRRSDQRVVALKLQYPHLQVQTAGDLWTLQMMAKIVGKLFPRCDFCWIVPEFQQNHTHEMDFRQEAFNSIRVRRLLRDVRNVYIPQVFWDMTSRRCLAMEFVDGVKVTDTAQLEAQGIDSKKVGRLASRVFGDLIFRHGFVHCDPHPGNLLARLDKKKEVELVLLDHGMYRRLSPQVRRGNCLLWSSLALADRREGAVACGLLGLPPQSLGVLSQLLMTRNLGGQDGWTADELTQRMRTLRLDDCNALLKLLPRDMLWVFRTLNILRCVGSYLGLSAAERALCLADRATAALQLQRAGETEAEAERVLDAIAAQYKELSKQGGCSNAPTCASLELPPLGPSAKDALLERLPEGSALPAAAWRRLWAVQAAAPRFLLSGAATLNLPVESEVVVRNKCQRRLVVMLSCIVLTLRRCFVGLRLRLMGALLFAHGGAERSTGCVLDTLLPPVKLVD